MRILGIDPGTITMGYGVIESQDDEIALIDCGALVSSEHSPIGERLSYLYDELLKIILRHRPEAVAVEQPFMAKNARSALAPLERDIIELDREIKGEQKDLSILV